MIRAIHKVIPKGLHSFTKRHVIPTDIATKKPSYPYISYKATSPYIQSRGFPAEFSRKSPSVEEEWEDDVKRIYVEQAEVVCSFNAYSDNYNEALDLAKDSIDWFKYHGYEYLDDNDIVVVEVMNLSDRTIHIVDHYEYRFGFDIRFRIPDVTKVRKRTIEIVDIELLLKE